jgi:UDPglucose 6-dehydrogenase/GDP-mannose 6-dehydrogenase
MKVSIIGTGYVGLVTGACLAEKGLCVTCVDIDKDKIRKIQRAIPPIFETGLDSLLKKNINKRLFTSCDLKKAVVESDISIIAVGTPFVKGKINLNYIKDTAKDIGKTLKDKTDYHVIVVKSTVPPGTTDELILPILERYSGKKSGRDFGIGMNPEFLREGSAISDFMNPDRIIIGGIDKKTTEAIARLYKQFKSVDILITNNKTAELIKYTSNSLLATLISFSNEIADICTVTEGVDIKDVMKGLHLDRRLNPMLSDASRLNPEVLTYLEAGCGFGGSCLPKDVKALISYTKIKGKNCRLLKSVIDINKKQPYELIRLLDRHYGSLKNLKVAVLGLAFKPGTDDIRESPAVLVIKSLLRQGSCLRLYDPVAKDAARKIFKSTKVKYAKSLKEAIADVDAVILITRWREFSGLNRLVDKLKREPLVIDGRRVLDKKEYKRYEGIGLHNGK